MWYRLYGLSRSGPCGKQKGKALSGATIGSVVANSPSPLDHNAERMTFVIRSVFVQVGRMGKREHLKNYCTTFYNQEITHI